MGKLKQRRNYLLAVGLLFCCLFSIPSTLASADSISHSYKAEGSVSNGDLVSLDPNDKNAIQPANSANGLHLLGVTVASHDSLLAINASSSTVQVALSGTVPALVSTLNGPIKTGDLISVSPVNGVGMKAEAGLPIIGQAGAPFRTTSSNAVTSSITSKQGKITDIKVGYINVALNVSKGIASNSASQLNALQRIAEDLTGHTVSTFRIVVALLISAIALVCLGGLMYGSIYSSIMSIGRNPLAKFSVLHSLRLVLILGLFIFLIAGLAVILLLD